MEYSVGIGLTNNCNLNCGHCYRDKTQISNITLEQIQILCNSLPIRSIGLGTGENILNPEFYQILEFISKQNINISIASNGLTLTSIPQKYLTLFHDVEVSIDFPSKKEQDNFRGKGNWDLVHQAIERCKNENLRLTILNTLMSTNYNKMDQMVDLARSHDVNLRVCVYQAVNSNKYHLSYYEFWEAFRLLLGSSKLISTSEPVVRAVLKLGEVYSPCGYKSIRINPRGEVVPCVYWGNCEDSQKIPQIKDLLELREKVFDSYYFRIARQVPSIAVDCPCQGGCASRRLINGDLNSHDEYCPWRRGDTIDLEWHKGPSSDLVRINNNCTTIVR